MEITKKSFWPLRKYWNNLSQFFAISFLSISKTLVVTLNDDSHTHGGKIRE